MSESQGRGSRDFSRYDSMETAELEELLRLDADTPEGAAPDVELILHVLEVLDKRNRIKEVVGDRTQEAYESFKQDYFPENVHIEETPKPVRRSLRLVRRLATAAAAVLVFVMLGSVTASAFGINIWKAVAVWAQETFHFESDAQVDTKDPNTGRKLEYSSLEDALYRVEAVSGVVPTWIPDGYELCELEIAENPLRKKYIAVYQDGDKYLKIIVQSYLDSYPEQIEQNEEYTDVYILSGITYHLFTDTDSVQAAWINGAYECYISGNITVDDIITMIESI